jgi:signal peptidase I
LAPGLGLLYCGRIRAATISLGAVVFPWLLRAVTGDPTLKILATGAHLILYAAQIVWSVVAAFREGKDYQLQRFNRLIVYALVFMLFTSIGELDSTYLTQVSSLNTTSMTPAIRPNDVVIVNKVAYHLSEPKAGDIAIYLHRDDSRMPFVGRLLALPGDRVELIEGNYLVNGNPAERAPQIQTGLLAAPGSTLTSMSQLQLGEDEYFLTGQNQAAAYDSRFSGPVKRSQLLARVDAVIYSTEKKGPRWGEKP